MLYFDYNATTPLDSRALEAMLPYLKEHFGNPASGQHAWGWNAEAAVNKARAQVAKLLNCSESEITFTSGATESNNTVLQGLLESLAKDQTLKPHLIISATEHSSVLNCAKMLAEKERVELTILPVDQFGRVDLIQFEQALKPSTKLVSFIWVNNEIGSLNQMSKISKICHERRIFLHTDATQAVGKIKVDLSELQLDYLSFSAHKIYGPKGCGVMYHRKGKPHPQPLLWGGGQESGLRSGTLNVPAIVGMGQACEIAAQCFETESAQLTKLRDLMIDLLRESIPELILNGHPRERSPINISVTFPKRIDHVLHLLTGIGFSTGSACSAGRVALSHVLSSIGHNETQAASTMRLSLGRWTTESDVRKAVEIIGHAFKRDGKKESLL